MTELPGRRPSSNLLAITCALCLSVTGAGARILFVPNDFPTIQVGIDSAGNGDTVLAEPGRYFENISFHGKNITVASRFILDTNLVWVAKTALDGSQSVNPDTASCVRIVSGEDSTCELVGFTITGGTGTKWLDEHGAGLFREGGGVLIQASSPVIRNNIITRNQATDTQGCVSAGGGGIRVGDGNPTIVHCVIDNNLGRYGAGIVLNYTGVTIRNTIVAHNSGGQDYGGAGIWAYSDGPAAKLIENCAIASNRCTLRVGGGMRFWSTSGSVRNCIVWGNTAPSGAQIYPSSGNPDVEYSDVQGGRAGTGNIDADPNWSLGDLMLHVPSACIDSGDPDTTYYDPDSAGSARWPALGTRRNDMGAYGGPLAMELGAAMSGGVAHTQQLALVTPMLVAEPTVLSRVTRFRSALTGPGLLSIYDASGVRVTRMVTGRTDAIELEWTGAGEKGGRLPAGTYVCMLTAANGTARTTVVLVRGAPTRVR